MGSDGTGGFSFLVAYEIATGGAAVISQRRFAIDAILLSDPARPRVFVVQQGQIVVIDASLNERIIPIPVTSSLWTAAYGGSRLAIVRTVYSAGFIPNDELVVVDVESGSVEATLPIPNTVGRIVMTADGQRLYRGYSSAFERGIEIFALPGGQPIARRAEAGPSYLFELDERRGVLLFDRGTALAALDARMLTPIGELGPGVFRERNNFTFDETTSGEAMIVRSSEFAPSYFGDCVGTRLDVFDGLTFGLVNQIDLAGACTTVVAIPRVPVP